MAGFADFGCYWPDDLTCPEATIRIKRGDDMEYVEIDGHKLHLFRAGDEKNPKLVFMSGSGTISPIYDFKILYEKLVSNFRIIVVEKFGYGCSDLYEGPCDIDSVVAYQREALEKAGEKALLFCFRIPCPVWKQSGGNPAARTRRKLC